MSSHEFPLELVEPRLVAIKLWGDFDGNAVHSLFDEIDTLIGEQPFWLCEVDISELGHANPSARRAVAERMGKTPEYSMALYGGGLAQRAISMLFLKVSELFGGNRDIVNKFHDDQPKARAWLREESRRRERKATEWGD